jgi:Transmembrane family 220, helix
MKIFNIVFALIFLSFAALQYNDPDPLLWIFIYGAMTVICALAVRGKVYKMAILVLGVGYIVYALMLLPSALIWFNSADRSLLFDDLAKMQNLYIEETREFLGLLICLIVLVINYFRLAKG